MVCGTICSMEIPKAIISDADGTLVNTLSLIRHGQYATTKKFLESHGIAPQDIPDFDAFQLILATTVGGSARHTLERTVRKVYKTAPRHLEGMDFDELHDLLNPVQDELAPEYVKQYEGLSGLLRHLGEAGIKLGIFTSGTPHHVVRNFGVALPELKLENLFRDTSQPDAAKLKMFVAKTRKTYDLPDFTVVTCEDVATHKPHPESLNLAMERLGVSPDEVLVFGDHTVDMEAGVNAGVAMRVGVTHGFSARDELLAAGATDTVDSLYELTDKLS